MSTRDSCLFKMLHAGFAPKGSLGSRHVIDTIEVKTELILSVDGREDIADICWAKLRSSDPPLALTDAALRDTARRLEKHDRDLDQVRFPFPNRMQIEVHYFMSGEESRVQRRSWGFLNFGDYTN